MGVIISCEIKFLIAKGYFGLQLVNTSNIKDNITQELITAYNYLVDR